MPFATRARRRGFSKAKEEIPYDVAPVNRSIENARLRIQDTGYDPGDTDPRNRFEKFTNLPKGQNAFFDVLELISRPGQAIMNVIDKGPEQGENMAGAVGRAAWRGFAGRDRVRGSKIIGDMGVDNPVAKAVLGTGLEIVTDPTSFIPAGVIAKGVSKVAKPVFKGFAKGYKAIEPQSVRAVRENTIQPAMQRGKDALGRAFVPDYKLGETLSGQIDNTILKAKQDTENRIRFMNEESLRNVSDQAKAAGGIDTGIDAGRAMEKDLKQSRRSDELLQNIMAGKPLSFNVIDGELKDFVDQINKKILSSPVVAKRVSQKQAQIQNVQKRIEQDEQLLERYRLQGRAGEALDNVMDRLDRYKEVLPKLETDVNRLQRGIVFNPREGSNVLDLMNETPNLYRKALGDQAQFIDEISPRGSFDQIVKPELREKLTPIVDQLLNDGVITTAGLKGTAELQELKKLFGTNLQVAHSKKGKTRLTLKQGDPDKMYFGLKGAKPVIPEELTDARTTKDPSQLERDDVQFMNRLNRVEIPREVRELTDNPAILEAAENLLKSNTELRQWATENGIPVGELQGYMTHVLAAEERKRRKNLRAVPIDRGNRGVGQPNKKVVNPRELVGSVEDINERIERPFFEPNAFFATAIGQKRLIEYANAAMFRREVLSNTNFAKKYEKGVEVPNNAVVIDSSEYKFLTDEASAALGLAEEIGGQYVVTKAVKQALDRYKKITTDDGINAFVKAFDTAQSWWKRTTLFSAPYHLRNAMGAMFNNYVGGMSPASLTKYTGLAYPEVYKAVINGQESDLFREFRKQGLGSTGLSGIDFARAGEDAEKAIERTIKKRSRFDDTLIGRAKAELSDLKNPLNVFDTSKDFGDFIDQVNKFALFKWSIDKGADATQAAKKVREVQFDYSRTTPFEKEVMVRIVPFYRWMRNNLPYQIRSFINDPRKYANVNKLRLNATEAAGFDEEDVPDWMREQFAIPVTGDGKTGKALGFNLPLGDLTKVSSPLQMLLNSLTPLAKLPAELALNRSFFYDRPIQEFEGQERQLSVPDSFYDIPIPGGGTEFGSAIQPNETLAYILEQIGGQPARQTLNLLASPKDEDQSRKFKDPVLGISSILKEIDAGKADYFQQREELQRLMDLIDYIQQQTGQRPRGVNEIK